METVEVISADQCQRVLQNFIGTKNVSLSKFSLEPLLECTGYISEQYMLKLFYTDDENEKTVQLFLKNLARSNLFLDRLVSEIKGFEKESFFYITLLPLFEAYGLDCDFAPKGYFSDTNLVVLEDLSSQSFKEFPAFLNLYQCKICLETLAKFHVSTIIYEIKKSKELERPYILTDDYKHILEEQYCSGKDIASTKFFKCSVKGLGDLADLIPIESVDKEKFKSKICDLLEEMFLRKSNCTEFKSTLVHGDVWYLNFFCQFDGTDRIKTCKLIDYQTMSYGPLASDVLQFIFINTRSYFRQLHYDELLQHYYNFFCSLLENQHIKPSDVLPEIDFKNTCKIFKPLAKLFAAVERGMSFQFQEQFNEETTAEEMLERFWQQDRGKFMMKSFEEDEDYRELMTEEITELASMIVEVADFV